MAIFGNALGRLFSRKASREAAEKVAKEKAAKEAGEQAAKRAAAQGLSEVEQQSAREAAIRASQEAAEQTATEFANGATVNVIGGTAKAVAPIIKAIGPSAVLAGLGFYIINGLGGFASEQIEQLQNSLKEILCDTENDDETCEQLVGSAIGLGGLFLAGGLILGITVLTRKKATTIVIEDKRE